MKNGGSLLFLTFFSLSMSEVEYLFIFLNRFIDIYFTFCIIHSFKVYSWMFLVYSQVLMPLHRGAATIEVNFSTSASLQIETHILSLKKQESSRKKQNIYFSFIDYAKAFDCVDHKNCGKFFKRWEYQTTWPAFWEICMQVKKQQLELDMEQQTGSRSGKEFVKAAYCHPIYLTYMQSISCKMPQVG